MNDNWGHLMDMGKVAGINLVAVVTSFTDVEAWVRITGLVLAALYTLAKLCDWIGEKIEKRRKDQE